MKHFEHWDIVICILVGIIMFGFGVYAGVSDLTESWRAQPSLTEATIQGPTQEPELVEEPVPIRRVETQIIKEWSGTGTKITEPFVIKEQPWGVQWEHDPKVMDGQSVGIFQLTVYEANTGGCIGELTSLVKENSGASCISKAGEFCLIINAANTDWTIVVTAPAKEKLDEPR